MGGEKEFCLFSQNLGKSQNSEIFFLNSDFNLSIEQLAQQRCELYGRKSNFFLKV